MEVARILSSGLGSVAWGGGEVGLLWVPPRAYLRDEFPGTCRSSVASVIPSHVCQTRAPVAALPMAKLVAVGVWPLKSRACSPPVKPPSFLANTSPVESQASRGQQRAGEQGGKGPAWVGKSGGLCLPRTVTMTAPPLHTAGTTTPPPHNKPVVSFQGV